MSLNPGARLGSYEIIAPIGAGGMGEVYRGRDTKLNRDVAIKVLPESFALDADRVARFTREAQVLASLNHPNIAAIYGVESNALVMELVDGEDLSELIARNAGSKDPAYIRETVLPIARQIADALDAAHEQGVVHRDLKPANVKVRADGTVKVLDFGLAKAAGPAGTSGSDAMNSPTLTNRATQMGFVLGTAAYMAPEQAKGRVVDKRADIWAFGVVLHEMLTGKRLFEAEDISETLAAVLTRDVSLATLPANIPPRLRALVRECLVRDPKQRLRDIGDARRTIDQLISGVADSDLSGPVTLAPAVSSASSRRTWIIGAVLAVLGAVSGAGLWNAFGSGARGADTGSGTTRLSISIPSSIHAQFAGIYGDGQTIIVVGFPRRPDGTDEARVRLWARRLDSYEFTLIPGTEGALAFAASRDGKWLALVSLVSEQSSQRRLAKIPVDGSSPPVAIADWDDDWGTFVWLEDGDLLVTSNRGTKFFRLPTNGGAAKAAIAFDTGDVKGFPALGNPLPGGRGVFFGMETWGPRGYQMDQWLLDVKTGKSTRILENAGLATYVSTGHLVFTRGTVLMAVPFSLDSLTVTGDVVALPGTVRAPNSWANGLFVVSENGTLLAAPGGRLGTNRRLVIADSTGKVTSFGSDPRAFETPPRVSADGGKVAVIIATAKGTYETWLAELNRSNVRRLLTLPNADCADPIWSFDGARVAYVRTARDKDDGLYVQRLDGSAPTLTVWKKESIEIGLTATSWAPNGDGLVFTKTVGGKGDIMFVPVPVDGKPSTARALRATANSEGAAVFSPDGRFVAFASDESGRGEVYVASYAAGSLGPAVVVSNGGGDQPKWAKDSRRLFFNNETDKVFVAMVSVSPTLNASTPVLAYDLKKLRVDRLEWDIMPDGRLLAIQKGEDEDDVLSYNVVLNWFDELRAKAPVRK